MVNNSLREYYVKNVLDIKVVMMGQLQRSNLDEPVAVTYDGCERSSGGGLSSSMLPQANRASLSNQLKATYTCEFGAQIASDYAVSVRL